MLRKAGGCRLEEFLSSPYDERTQIGVQNLWRDWIPNDSDLRSSKERFGGELNHPDLTELLLRACRGTGVSEDIVGRQLTTLVEEWNGLIVAFREVILDYFGVTEEFFENHPRRSGRYGPADREWRHRL